MFCFDITYQLIQNIFNTENLQSIGPEEYGRDHLNEVRDLVAELLLYESS